MTNFIDYYLLLEITYSASEDEINTGFKVQSLKWHPDRNTGINTTSQMQAINAARGILLDRTLRARYDVEYNKHYEYLNRDKQSRSKGNTSQQWFGYGSNPYNWKNDSSNIKFPFKTNTELIDICENALGHPKEYINQAVEELKRRFYTDSEIDYLLGNSDDVSKKVKSDSDQKKKVLLWILFFVLAISTTAYFSKSLHK